MNAKEARELAESLNNETNKAILKDVMSVIEGSVKRGEFSCTYCDSLNETIQTFLSNEGYKIKYISTYRDSYYDISW